MLDLNPDAAPHSRLFCPVFGFRDELED